MGWKGSISAGLRRFGQEAEKAIDKGKTKVEELQTEMQMDGLARKLGYLTYDEHRGRRVEEATKAKLLMDMAKLEGVLEKARAQATDRTTASKS